MGTRPGKQYSTCTSTHNTLTYEVGQILDHYLRNWPNKYYLSLFIIKYCRAQNTMPFFQSSTAKKCAGVATFVISHSDVLANLRAVLVQFRSFLECQFLLRNGIFFDTPVLWIGMPSTFNSTPAIIVLK